MATGLQLRMLIVKRITLLNDQLMIKQLGFIGDIQNVRAYLRAIKRTERSGLKSHSKVKTLIQIQCCIRS